LRAIPHCRAGRFARKRAPTRACSAMACAASTTRAANHAPYRPLPSPPPQAEEGDKRAALPRAGLRFEALPCLRGRVWVGASGASETESGMPDSFPLRSPTPPTTLRTAPSPALPRKRRRETSGQCRGVPATAAPGAALQPSPACGGGPSTGSGERLGFGTGRPERVKRRAASPAVPAASPTHASNHAPYRPSPTLPRKRRREPSGRSRLVPGATPGAALKPSPACGGGFGKGPPERVKQKAACPTVLATSPTRAGWASCFVQPIAFAVRYCPITSRRKICCCWPGLRPKPTRPVGFCRLPSPSQSNCSHGASGAAPSSTAVTSTLP
jgi:hypothetical protein